MGKLAELVTAEKKGPPCHTGVLFAELDAEIKTDLKHLLENGTPSTHIARALGKLLDRKVSLSSLQRHRKRECDCGSLI